MTDSLSTSDDNQTIHFDGREQTTNLALQLVQQARREICFFGSNLDAVLFDHSDIVDCISEFARRSDRTEVRFVVHSTLKNLQNSHVLLPLAQRLSSSIHIHTTDRQHHDLSQMFLLIDDNAYLYCKNNEVYAGRASLNDRQEVHSLKQTFSEIWNHSISDINTRRLGI
ncbi:hypothetical protein A9Q79_08975 [Methylophaga sp. 42_25_T18]|nr:hypothetical protein A9Q79_08975 [Methylophaga sp. 42_25_T18]OUR86039.1 hypothetical protein A9Q92_06710 [Methylophaga sp. 42_8_T64]